MYLPGVLGGHATWRDRSGHPPSHLSQPHLGPGFCHLMILVSHPCGETLSQGLKVSCLNSSSVKWDGLKMKRVTYIKSIAQSWLLVRAPETKVVMMVVSGGESRV